MISFDTFKPTEGTPIYQQILLYIKRGAVAGTIRDGDELPSRRVLSALLGINPNTVQKAYLELERRNITYSVPGVGRFVSAEGAAILKRDLSEAEELLRKGVEYMKRAEVPLSEVIRRVQELYGKNNDITEEVKQ